MREERSNKKEVLSGTSLMLFVKILMYRQKRLAFIFVKEKKKIVQKAANWLSTNRDFLWLTAW